MRDRDHGAVYVTVNENLETQRSEVSFDEVFGTALPNEDICFSFESHYSPYQAYCSDQIGGADLVIMNGDEPVRPLEIKLTVIPDSATYLDPETDWGPEIVIRPVTTRYAALGMWDSCKGSRAQIHRIFQNACTDIQDWGNYTEMSEKRERILDALNSFQRQFHDRQRPVLLQPIWKTDGRSHRLSNHAFDVFVWSDFALFRAFLDQAMHDARSISRYTRSALRLARILDTFARGNEDTKVAITDIYTTMAFRLQTDKEGSLNGKLTRDYLRHPRLAEPLLGPEVLPEIILGGGERTLSPERRLDQTIYFTALHLFGD